ncbi:F-box/FBD/LRR-repeat protein At1g13570 [Linum grandiflorum]
MTNPRLRKDRISSLPDGVREHILHFLPLKEAGKASILSSEWRNLWMNLPTLKFDQEFDTEGKGDVKKLMLDICRVLLLHREPLKEICLSLSVLEDFPDKLDEILLFLQNKRSIETLRIEEGYYGRDEYKLSKRLFSSYFSQLKTLRLSWCEVELSANSFEGFVKLTVLELDSVSFIGSDRLSFRCPLLESLSLYNCNLNIYPGSLLIEIEAPKLCCFRSVYVYVPLHLKHTPVLKMATIPAYCFQLSSDLLKVWGGLTSVESLSVSEFDEVITLYFSLLCLIPT